MARQKPAEVIAPPNLLKAKVGGKMPAFDEAAIARAEAALQNLSTEFADWMNQEVEKLDTVLAEVRAQGLAGEKGDEFYRCAHDLKGLGATYEFPIVTRLAGSLCRMIEEEQMRASAPISLVAAHVNAIKACVRDGVKSDGHPLGGALANELEAKVAELQNAA